MMKLSIITINYNNAEGLRKTLASVTAQSYKVFEHVIVDAASTDGSVDIIREYADKVSYPVIWSSEKDKGLYDGMNRGIKKATGEYVWILNSGDCAAATDTVERIMHILEKSDIDILLGNKIHVYPGDKKLNDSLLVKRVNDEKPRPMDVSMLTFYTGTVPQDAAFVRRELFEKYGYFDETMKICADWKLYLNMIALGGIQPMYVNVDVVLFDMTGISNANNELRLAERNAYLKEILPASILKDYENYAFPIGQYQRLKRRHMWGMVNFMERVLFKLEKWKILK